MPRNLNISLYPGNLRSQHHHAQGVSPPHPIYGVSSACHEQRKILLMLSLYNRSSYLIDVDSVWGRCKEVMRSPGTFSTCVYGLNSFRMYLSCTPTLHPFWGEESGPTRGPWASSRPLFVGMEGDSLLLVLALSVGVACKGTNRPYAGDSNM